MDQQEVNLSPAESPVVAPRIFIQVQTRKWCRKESFHPCLFILTEGKETHDKSRGKDKQGRSKPEKQIMESVMRGEGVSTPHVHRTRHDPCLLSNLWV